MKCGGSHRLSLWSPERTVKQEAEVLISTFCVADLYRIMSPVFMYEDGNEKDLEKAKKTAKDFCHYACNKFFSSIEQSAKMWKRFYKTRKKAPAVYVMQDGHLVEEPVR